MVFCLSYGFGFRLSCLAGLFLANAIEEDGGGLVIMILGDKFTMEGFGEDGLIYGVKVLLYLGIPFLDLASDFEKLFNAFDDFVLFGNWW